MSFITERPVGTSITVSSPVFLTTINYRIASPPSLQRELRFGYTNNFAPRTHFAK
jgi:hypothetical protein